MATILIAIGAFVFGGLVGILSTALVIANKDGRTNGMCSDCAYFAEEPNVKPCSICSYNYMSRWERKR